MCIVATAVQVQCYIYAIHIWVIVTKFVMVFVCREQYVKWRKEKKEQEEELCALQKKDTREKQECRESEVSFSETKSISQTYHLNH